MVIVVAASAAILAPQFVEQDARNKMRDACTASVSEWANIEASAVSWEDVSHENYSDGSWDFRGSYPGGSWACGGAAGNEQPASVMVHPAGEAPSSIVP